MGVGGDRMAGGTLGGDLDMEQCGNYKNFNKTGSSPDLLAGKSLKVTSI
jgi:hypothetical protein